LLNCIEQDSLLPYCERIVCHFFNNTAQLEEPGAAFANRVGRFVHQNMTLEYLLKMQCMQDGNEKEKDGFGLSMNERPQRIDVTGHAASAFIKTVENRIECRGVPQE
jgi:hypothetical protein